MAMLLLEDLDMLLLKRDLIKVFIFNEVIGYIQSLFPPQVSDKLVDLDILVPTEASIQRKQSKVVADSASEDSHLLDEDDDTSSDIDSDDEFKIDQSAIEALESKITYIKNCTKVDTINRSFSKAILFTIGTYLSSFIIALIVLSSLPQASTYIEFSDKLLEQGKEIYNAVYVIQAHLIEHYSTDILNVVTSDYKSQNFWPCHLGHKEPLYNYTVLNETNLSTGEVRFLRKCTFITKNAYKDSIGPMAVRLIALQGVITDRYTQFRRRDDILDKTYAMPFIYYEYYGPTQIYNQTIPNWSDFVSSKIIDAVSKLAVNHDFRLLVTQLDFFFMTKNRKIMGDGIKRLQAAVFEQILANRNQELIIHLVFSIIFVLLPFILVLFWIMPATRKLQKERLLLMKMILLLRKSLVWDFVYVTYAEKEDGEEEDQSQEKTEAQKLALSKAKARQMKTDDVIEVIDDNKRKLSISFFVILLSISIPVVVHCAWRYSDNQLGASRVDDYVDILTVYDSFHALRAEGIMMFLPKSVAPTIYKPYFGEIKDSAETMARLTDDVSSRLICRFIINLKK